jgi:acetylcholinesterase
MITNYTDVFYYKFTYIGRFSVFKHPRDRPFGMSHADDIQYILDTWYVGPTINVTDPENLMIERMTRIWEQFALNGNPNNSTDEYLSEMNWPQHKVESEYYLEIGQHLIEKQGLFLERFAVWDRLQKSAAASSTIALNLLLIIFISLSASL